MDEGEPIAYPMLDKGVPVISSDGVQVGTVDHVVAAAEQDIFHGIVIVTSAGHSRRFVQADDVAALHEHGVDLKIGETAARSLPEPGGAAPVFEEDPGEAMSWHHWAHKLSGKGDWKREP